MRLIGEFEATLDAKGRFLLPSKIKKELPEDSNNEFYITNGFEGCLELYPIKSWKPKVDEISDYDLNNKDTRQFVRLFLQGATNLELDSANRLLIPKNLITYAGLGKDIILCCAIDKIEIWDSNKYKKFFEGFTEEMFSDLAQKVQKKNKS